MYYVCQNTLKSACSSALELIFNHTLPQSDLRPLGFDTERACRYLHFLNESYAPVTYNFYTTPDRSAHGQNTSPK